MPEETMAALRSSVDADAIVACARELVRAPSENPPGDERAPAEVAARRLGEAGCAVEVIETAPRRINVVATLEGSSPGPTLLWNGHLDVVPVMDPGLWAHPPFEAVVADGLLHGRGSADMKGGIAAAVGAVSALRRARVPLAGRLVLHLVADEEVLGPLGTQELHRRGLVAADAAIVGEPTDLAAGIAERGLFWARVRTHGVAAHGSVPHQGVSAIEAMAKVVLALRGMRFDSEHPLLGPPTLNVGVIRGGAKINIVPASCEIEVDRRTIPGETRESVLAEMEEALARLSADDPNVKTSVEVVNWAPPCEIPEAAPIARLALEAYRAVRGEETRLIGMRGATDAHVLVNQANVPTVVFGPGSLSQAHTTTEHVRVGDLVDAAAMYAWMAARFLAPEGRGAQGA